MLQGMSEVQTNLTMSHNVPFDHLPSYKSTWELEIKPSTVFGMLWTLIIPHSIKTCQENKKRRPDLTRCLRFFCTYIGAEGFG